MRQKRKGLNRRSHHEKKRSFSREFKKDIVEAIVSGQASAVELSREYSISPVVISKWKKDYKA